MKQHYDTIRIELIVQACIGYEDRVYMHGSLEVFINQQKPYDESSDIVEAENLLDSTIEDGEYVLFSCCCGVPECSGWNRGIEVKTADNAISWTNLNTDESWTFEKTSLLEQIKTAKEEATFYTQYFQEKGIDYVGFGCNG